VKNCSTGAMTLRFARFANTVSFAVAVVVFQEKVGELATLCGLRRLSGKVFNVRGTRVSEKGRYNYFAAHTARWQQKLESLCKIQDQMKFAYLSLVVAHAPPKFASLAIE